jgi:hypothetical protein
MGVKEVKEFEVTCDRCNEAKMQYRTSDYFMQQLYKKERLTPRGLPLVPVGWQRRVEDYFGPYRITRFYCPECWKSIREEEACGTL